jgi:hypothetical protein
LIIDPAPLVGKRPAPKLYAQGFLKRSAYRINNRVLKYTVRKLTAQNYIFLMVKRTTIQNLPESVRPAL